MVPLVLVSTVRVFGSILDKGLVRHELSKETVTQKIISVIHSSPLQSLSCFPLLVAFLDSAFGAS